MVHSGETEPTGVGEEWREPGSQGTQVPASTAVWRTLHRSRRCRTAFLLN